MNVVLILFFLFGALSAACVPGKRVRVIRPIALTAAACALGCSFFCIRRDLQFDQALLVSELTRIEAGVAVVLCGAYFFTLYARGPAAKGETLCSLFFMASAFFGFFARSSEHFIAALLMLFFFAGLLLRLRNQETKRRALPAVFVGALLCLGVGFCALLVKTSSLSPYFLCFSFLCVLFAFPVHVLLPRLLAEAPFLLPLSARWCSPASPWWAFSALSGLRAARLLRIWGRCSGCSALSGPYGAALPASRPAT